MTNPFVYPNTGHSAIDVASRLYLTQDFDRSQLEAALKVEGLQSTVALAIKRRLRKLDKEESCS